MRLMPISLEFDFTKFLRETTFTKLVSLKNLGLVTKECMEQCSVATLSSVGARSVEQFLECSILTTGLNLSNFAFRYFHIFELLSGRGFGLLVRPASSAKAIPKFENFNNF